MMSYSTLQGGLCHSVIYYPQTVFITVNVLQKKVFTNVWFSFSSVMCNNSLQFDVIRASSNRNAPDIKWNPENKI